MRPARLVTAILASAFAAAAAHGSVTVEPTRPAVLPGFTAYEIYWNGPTDWTSAAIVVELTQGTFYQHPFETFPGAPPIPALFGTFPELEFDTYVGILDDGTGGIGGATCVFDCPVLDDPQFLRVSWFNTRTTDTGRIKIGNFTVTNDAVGTWSIISAGVTTTGVIPEPASLVLLTLAAPALLRRQSRTTSPPNGREP